MGVKPVEYIRDSSTSGFAVKGDKKDINATNANPIKKDVDQGNTKDLDQAQERFLENNVNYDELDYTPEENKNVGKNQIVTTGADKNSNGGVAGSTIAGAAGAAAAAGSTAAIAATTTTTITAGTGTAATFAGTGAAGANVSIVNPATIKTQTTVTKAADGFTQLIVSGALLALGLTTLGLSFTFDKTLNDKENHTNQAEADNAILQQYYEMLSENMDDMDKDSAAYTELCAAKLESDVTLINDIGALQTQIIEARAQGDDAKVAELQKEIEKLQKGAKEDTGNADEMDKLKGNLETYAARNAEAEGVKESGITVSDFLKQGHTYKTMAIINAAMYGLCGAYCIGAVLGMIPKLAPFFPDLSGNLAAKIMMGAAGLAFGAGALRMGTIAKKEGEAGKAGDGMAIEVANLETNIGAQRDYTTITEGVYAELDAGAAQEVQQTQQGSDDANKNLAQRLGVGGNNTNGDGETPPVTTPPAGGTNPTVGEGEPEPDDEGGMVA